MLPIFGKKPDYNWFNNGIIWAGVKKKLLDVDGAF